MGFNVEGKVALVTGANRGIGKAILEALLAAGARKVYAAVRRIDSADPLVDAHGGKVVPIHVEMDKPDTIEAVAAEATDVSLLVNNAGIFQDGMPLDGDAIDKLQHQMDVNVYGLMRIAQAFAPVLKSNGGGALVQLNSVASIRAFPGFAMYAASKAAAYSITQGLAAAMSEQGTQVLSVHPGPIDTDMASDAGLEDQAEPASVVADGIVASLAAGDFHLFPDSMAKQFQQHYEPFAKNIVEADIFEG